MSRSRSMALARLKVSGFRNLTDQVLELPPEGVALIGSNAQGKTNLLKAIYYLEAFRSFRGGRDEHLIRFGEDLFRLEGRLGAAGEAEGRVAGRDRAGGADASCAVAAAYRRNPREKRITLDGRSVDRLADAVGHVGAVLFTPEDVRLVSDGPGARRRFLDVLLSLNREGYLAALQRFRQALSQRNAALRAGGDSSSAPAWNEILVQSGARVTWTRASWLSESADRFAEYHARISGATGARILHDASIPLKEPSPGMDEVAQRYREALKGSADRERRQGTTLVGPHRDEVRFLVEGPGGEVDAREFGSGGQRRTVALALRLLEADAVREGRAREPILLLDDVFAELDEGRSRRVLGLLDQRIPGQVILAAPKASDIRFRPDALVHWRVEAGEVHS